MNSILIPHKFPLSFLPNPSPLSRPCLQFFKNPKTENPKTENPYPMKPDTMFLSHPSFSQLAGVPIPPEFSFAASPPSFSFFSSLLCV